MLNGRDLDPSKFGWQAGPFQWAQRWHRTALTVNRAPIVWAGNGVCTRPFISLPEYRQIPSEGNGTAVNCVQTVSHERPNHGLAGPGATRWDQVDGQGHSGGARPLGHRRVRILVRGHTGDDNIVDFTYANVVQLGMP